MRIAPVRLWLPPQIRLSCAEGALAGGRLGCAGAVSVALFAPEAPGTGGEWKRGVNAGTRGTGVQKPGRRPLGRSLSSSFQSSTLRALVSATATARTLGS